MVKDILYDTTLPPLKTHLGACIVKNQVCVNRCISGVKIGVILMIYKEKTKPYIRKNTHARRI